MQRFKTIVRVIALLVVGGFFHYVLPQHDVVTVTSTGSSGWLRK